MIKYLSPSSLKVLETQPETFYLTRLADDKSHRDPQSIQAGVGSAFDARIRAELVKRGLVKSEFNFDEEVSKQVEPRNMEEALRVSKAMSDFYFKTALISLKWSSLGRDASFTLKWKGAEVPIFCRLDSEVILTVEGEDILVPFDWKSTGYASASGGSPKQGYAVIWNDVLPNASHKGYYKDIPWENIASDWATQVCTYWFALGNMPGERDGYAIVDQLIIRPTGSRVARYLGRLTQSWQRSVADRFVSAWQSIPKIIEEHKKLPRLVYEMERLGESWY